MNPNDPRRDSRPWEGPLNPIDPNSEIHEGDLVLASRAGTTRTGYAHHRDTRGRWLTADGTLLVPRAHALMPWKVYRIPEPPLEPFPTTPGAIIREVTIRGGMNAPFLVLAPDGCFYGDVTGNDDTSSAEQVTPNEIDAFTDPDGTAWRRDDVDVWQEAAL